MKKEDDEQVCEWWYAEREPLRVRWSPVQLWIETVGNAYVAFVVCDNPTYGDIKKLLAALRIELPTHWHAADDAAEKRK